MNLKMKEWNFDVVPCPAPRMTQADKWAIRPIVQKYYAFRNELKYIANLQSLHTLPGEIDSITFGISMPASWSKKKKAEMIGQPHQQIPDLDNYLKGFLDALCSQDSHIHSIRELRKVWSTKGSIRLRLNSDFQ